MEYVGKPTLIQRNSRVVEHDKLLQSHEQDCNIIEIKSLLNDQLNGLMDILPSVYALNSAVLQEGESRRHVKSLCALVENSVGLMNDVKGIANFAPIVKKEIIVDEETIKEEIIEEVEVTELYSCE